MQDFSNNAAGVLSVGISNVATSISLTDASSFPAPAGGSYFLATLIGLNANGQESAWEIVKCTARAANTLTVTRAQEGTVAANWGVATRLELRLTAGSLAAGALALKSATTTVSVGAAAAPTIGQVLTATSGTAATWQAAGGFESNFLLMGA